MDFQNRYSTAVPHTHYETQQEFVQAHPTQGPAVLAAMYPSESSQSPSPSLAGLGLPENSDYTLMRCCELLKDFVDSLDAAWEFEDEQIKQVVEELAGLYQTEEQRKQAVVELHQDLKQVCGKDEKNRDRNYLQYLMDRDISVLLKPECKVRFLGHLGLPSKYLEVEDDPVFMETFRAMLADLAHSLATYFSLNDNVRNGLNKTAQDVIGGIMNGTMDIEDLDLVKLGNKVFSSGGATDMDIKSMMANMGQILEGLSSDSRMGDHIKNSLPGLLDGSQTKLTGLQALLQGQQRR